VAQDATCITESPYQALSAVGSDDPTEPRVALRRDLPGLVNIQKAIEAMAQSK